MSAQRLSNVFNDLDPPSVRLHNVCLSNVFNGLADPSEHV